MVNHKKALWTILCCFILINSFGQGETVTMKEYTDKQDQLNKEWSIKYMDAQFENIRDNVNKALANMDKRMDGVNEFRAQLKDQAGTFITRSELFGYVIGLAGIVFALINLQRKKIENQVTNKI